MNPSRVLVAGDVHGTTNWFGHLCKQARKHHCEVILQLGDFGYWEHVRSGRLYLDKVSSMLGTDLKCVFIDGNHENHPLLWQWYPEPNRHGFRKLRHGLYYAPRGHRWEWQGKTFVALGGGFSVDLVRRIEGESWWATELITKEEAERAKAGGKADVLVCHDAPAGVDVGLPERSKNMFWQTNQNRAYLHDVMVSTDVDLVLHGHYHWRHSTTIAVSRDDNGKLAWQTFNVEGFGRDGDMQKGWGILELPSLRVNPQYPVDALSAAT